jgi:hypothetical protein
VQYSACATEGPGQECNSRIVIFTSPTLPHRELDDHVLVNTSRIDYSRRILHMLTDDAAAVDDLVKKALIFARSNEYARVHPVQPGPPASRGACGFHVVFQLGSHPKLHQVRHEFVRAGVDQVFTLIADVRRRINVVSDPGRDQHRAAERLGESRGSGNRCERVEKVRRNLECEIPACRITADDDVRRRDALLEEMREGRVSLPQLSRDGRVGSQRLRIIS